MVMMRNLVKSTMNTIGDQNLHHLLLKYAVIAAIHKSILSGQLQGGG